MKVALEGIHGHKAPFQNLLNDHAGTPYIHALSAPHTDCGSNRSCNQVFLVAIRLGFPVEEDHPLDE